MTNKGLTDYEKLISDETDKQMLTTDREDFANLVRAVEEVLPLSRANKKDEARQLLREKAFPVQDKLAKALDQHIQYNIKLATEGAKTAEESYASARRNGFITIVVVAVVLFFLVILISRSITGPVSKASALAEIMASGDFTSKLSIHQKDEIGMMTRSLNSMSGQLGAMIKEIITGVNNLTSSSNDLARQTAAATVDIKNQIGEMQTTTTTTIEDIEKISEVISEINNVINGIATAVEEQAAASREISENVVQASQGIAEVNENVAQSTIVIADITRDIAGINQQAKQVGDGSSQVQLSAHGLSKLAVQLDTLVKKFKV